MEVRQNRVDEWVRYYEIAGLKFGALRAVLENDGEQMLEAVLKKLKLKTAADIVKAVKR